MISIIVPVYNTAKYLEKCVDSLLQQTYTDTEILLIDDGSTDESPTLCEHLGKMDSRLRVIHKENGGLISAWKCGVTESRGTYLCFVDSDDWIDPEMLKELSEQLTGQSREIIASDYVIEGTDGTSKYVWQQLEPGIYDRLAIEERVIPKLLGYEKRFLTISRCMKLIHRDLIVHNMKYSDPQIVMGEDLTVMLPALLDCERLVIMDHKAYYHYLYVNESMVHKYNAGLYQNIEHLLQIIRQVIEEKTEGTCQEYLRQQADKEAIFLLLLVLKDEARGNPAGCKQNIQRICRLPKWKEAVKTYPVEVQETANKLLYFVLRHPNRMSIWMLQLAMRIYYRK